jgi:hypothetical protein
MRMRRVVDEVRMMRRRMRRRATERMRVSQTVQTDEESQPSIESTRRSLSPTKQ